MIQTCDNVKLCDIVLPVTTPTVDKTTPEYKEFLGSVRRLGVVTPIVVSPTSEGKYTLVTGLYRYMASVDAHRVTIPAQVHKMTEAEIAEMQLLHCKHRIETTPADYAKALKRLLANYTVEEIAVKINRSVAWVKEKLK